MQWMVPFAYMWFSCGHIRAEIRVSYQWANLHGNRVDSLFLNGVLECVCNCELSNFIFSISQLKGQQHHKHMFLFVFPRPLSIPLLIQNRFNESWSLFDQWQATCTYKLICSYVHYIASYMSMVLEFILDCYCTEKILCQLLYWTFSSSVQTVANHVSSTQLDSTQLIWTVVSRKSVPTLRGFSSQAQNFDFTWINPAPHYWRLLWNFSLTAARVVLATFFSPTLAPETADHLIIWCGWLLYHEIFMLLDAASWKWC